MHLTVVRGGDTHDITVTLGDRPANAQGSQQPGSGSGGGLPLPIP